MRPASSRVVSSRVVLWITLLLISAAPFASAQTDTWTGSGGTANWSNASNWNNGAITTGENILINLTTAATVDDFNVSIGNLTLSNAGDSVTTTGATLTVNGTITNNGTINLDATQVGSQGVLYVGSNSTLTGTGALVLGNGVTQNFITGTSGAILTNSSTIEGGWTGTGYTGIGQGQIALANSGTINANLSGGTLYLDPTGSVGSTNTGTLEATNGATLLMSGGTWTQTGAGTISAATGSTVALQNGVSITGGTLTTTGTGLIAQNNGGTVSLNNLTLAGTYDIQIAGGQTNLSGTITNKGTINLLANQYGAQGVLNLTGNTTLTGTGTLVLGNETTQNFITGNSGLTLTNDSTIEGGWNTSGGYAGIGQGQIAVANNGIINANVSGGSLYLDPTSSVGSTNTKTLEATNDSTLQMSGGTWTQTGAGTISAAAGSTVALQNSVSITGGTLTTAGSGLIAQNAGGTVSLSNLTNAGTYQIQIAGGTTDISGTITNNGTINLLANSYGAQGILYLTANTTLTGTGAVVIGNETTQNFIDGASGTTLTNASTIEGGVSVSGGFGGIGNGDITVANTVTINANVTGGLLYVNPLGSGTNTNTGKLEATAGGELVLDGSSWNNAGGTITAAAGSAVDLENNVSITGGTLTTTGSGVIEQNSGGNVFLTNITNTGNYTIPTPGTTEISGTITNNGSINLLASDTNGGAGELYLAANSTLKGTGVVVLGDENTQNFITGVNGTTLTNDSVIEGGATIRGNAQIGLGQINLVNNGTINANGVSGTTLFLNPLSSSTSPATNTATMEATNGGTLVLSGGYWTQTGAGTISAAAGSTVQLQSGVTITGGKLTTSGTGVIENVSGQAVSLSNLTNAGALLSTTGFIDVSGTITNTGTISLESNGGQAWLNLTANTALTGSGAVVLGNQAAQNFISGNNGGFTLTNASTIEGGSTDTSGGWDQVGNGQILLANSGTINANVSGGFLYANPLTSGTSTNTGKLEATNGGTLFLDGGNWTQTGVGTVSAATASTVQLINGVSITGGTLTTIGTGVIETPSGQSVSLSNLTNSGTLDLLDSSTTTLSGTITNNGTVNMESAGGQTFLAINGAVTLKGTGALVLGNGGPNYITGTGTTPVLTNQSTIEGTGYVGNGSMGFTNTGTLNSNVSGGALAINVNSSGFTNYNGTTTTLTGGTYIANGGNITFAAGNNTGITTLAASVTEEAGGQLLNTTNNTNALASLTSITSAGALTTNVNFTDAGAFSNAGSLTILGGTSFSVGSLSQISGGSLTAGTYVLDANLSLTGATQSITTNAATLVLAGGTIENANNSNALAGLAVNSGKLTVGGSSNNVATTAASFSNTGTLTINSGDSFTAKALTQISGTTLSAGTYVLGGNLDLSTGTANITTNSATLTIEGGTIENTSNSSNALLNLAANTKSLTLADNANFTTTGNFNNTGTLTVNSGSTFTVLSGKALANYKPGTNTLTGGTYVVGGTLAFNAGATGGIKTDSANITLEGSGEMKNTTSGAPSTNALINLATISSTGSLTLADNANFTAAGNFTNDDRLIVNSGSSFALTGSNVLTNLASGTLTGGSYTVGGTLQLTSANGGITTNAATLTLTGTSAKILDGTTNALAGFNNNTGSLTLSADAVVATANNFTNSGTVDVAKGSTFTVSGTGHSYMQTAGQTTIDGTLAGIPGGASITGGTILGSGVVKGNLSVGNATGTAATINVGDNAKAGLLSITGKYTQLATGTMTGLVAGTAAGTGFSQLKVTGTAALAGTINFTVATAFQSSLTLGETFTVLTSSGVSGTFSNSTIAINGTFQFNVSYTSTAVVLTVAATTPDGSHQPGAQTTTAMPVATAKLASAAVKRTSPVVVGGLRRASGTSKISRPVVMAAWTPAVGHSDAILAGGFEKKSLRSWERVSAISVSRFRTGVAMTRLPSAVNASAMHSLPASDLRMGGESHAIGIPVAGWMDATGGRRAPVKLLAPMLPRMSR
jgi:fibronectin-binding autotransporter adhesin